MSLKELAKHAAAHGRGGDTELVHMSRDEVKTLKGLAALNGTNVTYNPHTGLPEAFNLGKVFKTILPIAASIGGSFVGMPYLGALVQAGLTTAESGDLGKGLLAGVGSYAMGNLGSAAVGAGGQALANTAAQTAAEAGTQAATQAVTDTAAQAATQGAGQAVAQGATDAATQAASQQATQGALQQAIQQSAAETAQQQAAEQAQQAALAQVAQGGSAVPTAAATPTPADIAATQAGPGVGTAESLQQQFPRLTPDQITQVTSEGQPDLMAQRAAMLNQFGQADYTMDPTSGTVTQAPPIGGMGEPTAMQKLGALGVKDYANIAMENPAMTAAAGMGVMNALTPDQEQPGGDTDMIGARLDPNYFRNLHLRQQQARGFASGGLAALNPKSVGPVAFDAGGPVPSSIGNDMFPQANMQSPMYSQATQAPMERAVLRSGYMPMTDPGTGDQTFAHGGLAQLNKGRAIRGPGDGMSDDIPAHIGGVEPAALADGEYVLPADVVSHLGNGSTEAGTRKLDGMMARIRKARTGNAKQGSQINADRFLPA